MAKEVWKTIPGFEGLYEASTLGHIKSVDRAVHTNSPIKGRYVKYLKSKMLSAMVTNRGYHYVYLRKYGLTHTLTVHSLVLLTFHGPRPAPYMQGRHLDGDPTNNTASNLAWTTPLQNQQDRLKHGTHDHGENSANAKLTWAKVASIRKSNKSQHALAAQYNVSQSIISDIKRGLSWRKEYGKA